MAPTWYDFIQTNTKTTGVVEQSPLYVNPQQGQSISITCALRSSREDEEIYLLKTHMQPERVLHVSSQNDSTIFPAFYLGKFGECAQTPLCPVVLGHRNRHYVSTCLVQLEGNYKRKNLL
uniref:Uncharacterized protein n=1 Tax=Otus sunia TaxID=257818 RepID=A0A8C8EEV5_9STRI